MAQQVHKYAEYIGVDLATYPELFNLMEEGLKAPLPPEWEIVREGQHHVFVNSVTGERTNDHPSDDYFRRAAQRRIQELGVRTRAGGSISPLRNRGGTVMEASKASRSKAARFAVYLFLLSVVLHFVISSTVFRVILRGVELPWPDAGDAPKPVEEDDESSSWF